MIQVWVTNHALSYIRGGLEERTKLDAQNIYEIINIGAFETVHAGETSFLATWDWHAAKAIFLLTGNGTVPNQIAIISVWGIDYKDLPFRFTTEQRAEVAKNVRQKVETWLRSKT